ncbi:spore protease YyaC [Thermaerobacter sp. PB12/4term]|uniref:spore protease YyaC n=1 Tax=Thermaerobacter sp. PB12/4term TaxID=2293838 RepID=UPI000E329F6B|nr:spore protease YyaC [Thermaerobacter sp. PB12/4term]QIA28111.1 spore protease YyaC [Thermaerobacter sp. PB12/4term]
MPRRDTPQAQEGPALPPFRAELRVRAEDPRGWQLLGETLAVWLEQRGSRRLAVVCIGTDRSTGDALGPLVGTLLARSGEVARYEVVLLGTLDEPVHAGNLDQAIARLAALETGTTVLAVDACLGRSENVGSISAGRGALQPGAGVNKSLPAVGHLFVTGTVNVGGFMEYFVLQNTRLGLVLRMAEAIAAGIALAARLHFARPGPARAAGGVPVALRATRDLRPGGDEAPAAPSTARRVPAGAGWTAPAPAGTVPAGGKSGGPGCSGAGADGAVEGRPPAGEPVPGRPDSTAPLLLTLSLVAASQRPGTTSGDTAEATAGSSAAQG